MVNRIMAVAINTFREAIRNRFIYGIAMGVLMVNLMSLAITGVDIEGAERTAKDLSLAGVSLFGSVIAVILGVSLLHGELKKRTIHTLLSKPIRRFEFVFGKYFGMGLTLVFTVVMFVIVGMLALKIQRIPLLPELGMAVYMHLLEILVVAAIAMFFSSFSSPFFAGVFTLGTFVIGRTLQDLRALAESTGSAMYSAVSSVVGFLVPDLYVLSPSGRTIDGQANSVYYSIHDGAYVTGAYLLKASLFTGAWILFLLLLSSFLFSRREYT